MSSAIKTKALKNKEFYFQEYCKNKDGIITTALSFSSY